MRQPEYRGSDDPAPATSRAPPPGEGGEPATGGLSNTMETITMLSQGSMGSTGFHGAPWGKWGSTPDGSP